ncbi:hypothetical protein C789_1596 [Microcystis aeruginosa FACHB-905 = DIANCHI905]|nr:hypothetical protein C789_1596 [Microcystis aeruginosa FACHB-905 = DIANCHI905]
MIGHNTPLERTILMGFCWGGNTIIYRSIKPLGKHEVFVF